MRIELNLPRGERQSAFMAFLNNSLRERMKSANGLAELDDDGLFVVSTTGPFEVDGSAPMLTWRLHISQDGRLLGVSVQSDDPTVSETAWEGEAHLLITASLANALADARSTFFIRTVFYYLGPQLDGEYWLRGYRFAPAIPDDPEPYLVNAERVVVIDQDVSAIDSDHAHQIAGAAARRHAARLSLLLNTGLYTPEHDKRWVWSPTDGIPDSHSRRHQLGYSSPSLAASSMPQKGSSCAPGRYDGTISDPYAWAGKLLSLPKEARRILRAIDSAPPAITSAFDNCARLYQVATVCGRMFPSVGLAYRVAAVEAVSSVAPANKGFSKFMRAHVRPRADLDELLNYMHGSVRSAHFHAGAFPLGEYAEREHGLGPLMNIDAARKDSLHHSCFALTREAIINWLASILPQEEPNGD